MLCMTPYAAEGSDSTASLSLLTCVMPNSRQSWDARVLDVERVALLSGNPAQKMQHWLKGISPASAPFSQSFEDLLRTNSGKKSSQKPKAKAVDGQRAEGMPEVSCTDPRANGPSANEATESSKAANRQDHAQALQVFHSC